MAMENFTEIGKVSKKLKPYEWTALKIANPKCKAILEKQIQPKTILLGHLLKTHTESKLIKDLRPPLFRVSTLTEVIRQKE